MRTPLFPPPPAPHHSLVRELLSSPGPGVLQAARHRCPGPASSSSSACYCRLQARVTFPTLTAGGATGAFGLAAHLARLVRKPPGACTLACVCVLHGVPTVRRRLCAFGDPLQLAAASALAGARRPPQRVTPDRSRAKAALVPHRAGGLARGEPRFFFRRGQAGGGFSLAFRRRGGRWQPLGLQDRAVVSRLPSQGGLPAACAAAARSLSLSLAVQPLSLAGWRCAVRGPPTGTQRCLLRSPVCLCWRERLILPVVICHACPSSHPRTGSLNQSRFLR